MKINYLFLMLFSVVAHIYAADDFQVILPNKETVTIPLGEEEPNTLETFSEIIDNADQKGTKAFLVAIPHGNGHHILNGNYFFADSYGTSDFVNPMNQQSVNQYHALFIGKNSQGSLVVDYADTVDLHNPLTVHDKVWRVCHHFAANFPGDVPGAHIQESKIILSQARVAEMWLNEKHYTKAPPLLQKVLDNTQSSSKQKERAAFLMGQLYFLGKGCDKDLQKAHGYFRRVVGDQTSDNQLYRNMFAAPESNTLQKKAQKYIAKIEKEKN